MTKQLLFRNIGSEMEYLVTYQIITFRNFSHNDLTENYS